MEPLIDRPQPPSLGRRLAWFVALWIIGVAAISVVGFAIKLALRG